MDNDSAWNNFLAEVAADLRSSGIDYPSLPSARAILESMDRNDKARMLVVGVQRLHAFQTDFEQRQSQPGQDPAWKSAHAIKAILETFLNQPFPLHSDELEQILRCANHLSAWSQLIPLDGVLRAAERHAQAHTLTDQHRAHLISLRSDLLPVRAAWSQVIHDIDRLLAKSDNSGIQFERGDAFSDLARADLKSMDPAERDGWQKLLNHAATATTSKPSAKWLKAAAQIITAIKPDRFVQRFSAWLSLVGKPGPGRLVQGFDGDFIEPTMLAEHNVDILKGICWAASTIHDEPHIATIARLLGDVAEACFKKIPKIGARCPRAANAALVALSLMPGPEPVAQLTRIQSKSKKPSAKKLVESALKNAAAQQQVTPDELEEMSVPDFGLNSDGIRSTQLGDWTAELYIAGTRDADLRWRKTGAPKAQSSIPADIKRDHADALKDLKRHLKDLEQVLPTQAARIERLLLDQRTWPLDTWRKRYLDHPLVSHITRRLIWEIVPATPPLPHNAPRRNAAPAQLPDPNLQYLFIPNDGAFRDANNNAIEVPTDSFIRLWHPITSPADVVASWRTFLENNTITQPFKQAHREIYVITDAERATATYSNRFAAHILRQHQFHALCGTRGWSYALMGNFDSFTTPTRKLPAQNLRVEFWVEGTWEGDRDLSPTGIFLRVVTDQVRFYPLSEQEPMNLADVPRTIFSELMRDVDLFVGVCSIGNDPTWHDRGEAFAAPPAPIATANAGAGAIADDYWQNYAWGSLSQTAQTRRDVLASLLPKLKIADRATLDDKYLIIRGDIRTYKIHLGSGNILMEPNDQYLCIVADRSVGAARAADIFLPFEGDTLLSVILSKALMLANDTRITDRTITRQIGG